ncbi:hypothetical protein GCM10023146_15930 [Nocardioides caricicola]
MLLEPAEGVETEQADQREAEHRHRVGPPVLVGVRVDAQQPVRRALGREVPGRRVDVGEVAPEERDREGQGGDEHRDLAESGSELAHLSLRSRAPTSTASSPKATRVRST